MSEEEVKQQVISCLVIFEAQRTRYIKYMEEQLFQSNHATLSAMGLTVAEQKTHPKN